jgi:hypothetical protein
MDMRKPTQLFSLSSLIVAGVASALVLSGCATLFSGSSQEVEIESKPSNANVMVDGKDQGTTPTTIEVKRPEQGDAPEITLNKEGYEETALQLERQFNAVTLVNIINPLAYFPLGIPATGFAVDWYTGALWKYKPAGYTVELQSGSASSMAPTPYKNKVERSATSSETVRYTLRSLPTNEEGDRVVPNESSVTIYDSETGTVYTFR